MTQLLDRAKEIDAEKFAHNEAKLADMLFALDYNKRLFAVYEKLVCKPDQMPDQQKLKLLNFLEHLYK